MMKGFLLVWLVILTGGLSAQVNAGKNDSGFHGSLIDDTQPVYHQNLDTISPPLKFDNLYSRQVHSDSLSSSFVIFIRHEVKEHKHLNHSETIVVLAGEAMMTVEGKEFKIKKGSVISVPQNTWHGVKVGSKIPLKVLSVQSPNFDGKDRIFKESK